MLLGRFVLDGFVLASVERSSETRSCCCGASLAKVGSGAEPDSFVAEEFRDRKDGTLGSRRGFEASGCEAFAGLTTLWPPRGMTKT